MSDQQEGSKTSGTNIEKAENVEIKTGQPGLDDADPSIGQPKSPVENAPGSAEHPAHQQEQKESKPLQD